MLKKRKIFIASATDFFPVVQQLQLAINRFAHEKCTFAAITWKTVFPAGQFNLISLIEALKTFDYAIMLLTADDELAPNLKKRKFVPRDNLLFELGLAFGLLGLGRVIAVKDSRLQKHELLTDFDGITWVNLEVRDGKVDTSSLDAVVTEILNSFIKTDPTLDGRNYFKLKMQKWRNEREADKFIEINKGKWDIYALNENQYKRYVFGGVLSVLSKGDVYLTVSNLNFWSGDGFDVEDFIQNNIDALKREVQIKRIIIIDNYALETNTASGSFKSHYKKLLEELIKKIEEQKNIYKGLFKRMELYFLLSDDYKKDIDSAPVPYALIQNDHYDDYAMVTPDYEKNPKLITISFKEECDKKDRPYNYVKLVRKFNQLFNHKERLSLEKIKKQLNLRDKGKK